MKINTRNILSQVPVDYYFKLNLFQKLWHQTKEQILKNLLKKYCLSPQNILEIGCAAGHLSSKLAKLYPKAKVTGIDLYQPAIYAAQKRFPKIKFMVADAHRLPFSNHAFDLIVCSETIEHVKYPLQVLNEIKRLLTKKGIAIIEMDSGNILFKLIWYFWINFGKGKVWKNAHLHNLDAKILKEFILLTKFKIIEKKLSHLYMAVSFVIKNN